LYDARNEVTKAITPLPSGNTKVITYAYDPGRRQTLMAVSTSGTPGVTTSTYAWDCVGRQTNVTDGQNKKTTMGYDPVGRVTLRQYASGALTTHTFDPAGNLLAIHNRCPSGTAVSTLTYAYDNVGNRTAQYEGDGTVTTWTYDDSYQLVNEQRTVPTTATAGAISFNTTFVYDNAGNRTLMVDADAGTTTYTYSNANRLLLAVSPTSTIIYSNDPAGNRTLVEAAEGYTYYTWDAAGRMAAAEPPAGAVTFTYDTDGRRVGKRTPDGANTRYLYSFKTLLQEGDDEGEADTTYTDQEFGDLLSEYGSDGSETYPGSGQWPAASGQGRSAASGLGPHRRGLIG
jgi:YD repeat-containing protein